MSMCRVVFCFWKRVFAVSSAFSWLNSVSLCPASFCIPRPNLPVTPGISWLPTFAFQFPMMNCGVGEDSWEFLGLQGDPRVFIGRTDAKTETPILWPPHAKSWLIGKDPDAGRDWGQEEKGTTEDEMAGWHHRLDGHEFGWTPGVGDGQGGLACWNSWVCKESDTTEWLNWTELNWT